jgi:hypothetical protein
VVVFDGVADRCRPPDEVSLMLVVVVAVFGVPELAMVCPSGYAIEYASADRRPDRGDWLLWTPSA